MTRRAILHIGTEKTGTTTLQHTLARNAGRLAEAGFRYPLLGAGNAHVALVYYAKLEGAIADLPALSGADPTDSRAAFDARVEAELAAEVAAHPDATFLFSSEHASSRLNDMRSLGRLKDLLAQHFDTIDIVVYLRRWDRMAQASYSTSVRNGLAAPFTFQRYHGTTLLDYQALLARWGAVFGEDRLIVGLYDRAHMIDGSIVADFAARVGLPPLEPAHDANASFDGAGLALLGLVNRALEARPVEEAARLRERVAQVLPRGRAGGASAPRRNAEAFVRRYADQAEAIRARHFPNRASLFDDRFDDYPEEKEAGSANWRDLCEVLIDALARSECERAALAAERHAARAGALLADGDLAPARVEAEAAVRLDPENAGHRALRDEIVVALSIPAAS